ncbi:trehalose-6-phosphate synthase [Actinoalloteichus sp. AHMU CJ021]|uniref:Trehalose 6-phosphate synthase n=1 Tax=Actinoalloteichus caeruleus DSM 43889 TaxID=1120930 RepID=A0ABT1JKC7_ACTCY|nr:trehalose-6-phosphate synthase [Actinoalloteichus caeruleus]AUS78516.1 trehalose-6-phosphate synthase [Actinoalloteichus sp. AHMU CJ021]MCP2332624.1 trehalose 6-phosphate synthase (EC 2.4.1.15) [Actinoalloteichus caeruleus DSM 43889]
MGSTTPASTGADFVVVANRLPVDLERLPDGTERWRHSPGGLVTALEPFLRARKGAWVGWPGIADADVAPFEDGDLRLHPVSLSSDEFRDYYEGFSNATLWPLYHDVVATPVFDRTWWDVYVRVNQRFAEATASVAAEGATIWVQDYQLQLVPAMLRDLRPDLRIGFFLHIPFPPVELFMQLPWRTQIVRGLLGADLVGFHRPGGAQNFLWLARRLAGFQPTKGSVGVRNRPGVVQVGDRPVRVGAFPISIDSSSLDQLAASEESARRAAQLRADLGNPRRILLGVDRLDYTKGIDLRLHAFRELLAEERVDASDTVMVQLATPSRERLEHYKKMREEIEREVGRINGEFSRLGRPAVHYLHSSIDRKDLVAFYCAADVMVVTPVRDGMNLVCKEYVACRNDLGGALVLSEFAGAAAELTSAFLVNPHDLEGVKDALEAALNIDPAEGRRRMRALRRQVLNHDVDRWARSFLEALGAQPNR